MRIISAKWWNGIGCGSIALVLVSIPYGLVDGVMGLFFLYAAVIVGGFSGVGLKATAVFGIAVIVASLLLTLFALQYTSPAGFSRLQIRSLWTAFSVLSMPIAVSAAFLVCGVLRRRAN